MGKHICKKCGKGRLFSGVCGHCSYEEALVPPGMILYNDFKMGYDPVTGVLTVIKIMCECGGEKTNTTHSDWCPKH